MLRAQGLVGEDELRVALLEHSRTGDPLGDILVAHQAIPEDVLVAALADIHGLARVGLVDAEPDLDVAARRLPEPLARTLRAIPLAETRSPRAPASCSRSRGRSPAVR